MPACFAREPFASAQGGRRRGCRVRPARRRAQGRVPLGHRGNVGPLGEVSRHPLGCPHGGSDQAPRMGRRRRRDSSRERVTIIRPPVHGSRAASLMLGPLGEPEAITVRRPATPKRNETALLAFVGPYRAGSSWRRPREPSSGIVVRLRRIFEGRPRPGRKRAPFESWRAVDRHAKG